MKSNVHRARRVRLFGLGQVIIKLQMEEILASRVTYGSQMTNNKTGEFSNHYLFAWQISFTGKSKHKLHRSGLISTHNGCRISIKAFQKAFKKIYLCF